MSDTVRTIDDARGTVARYLSRNDATRHVSVCDAIKEVRDVHPSLPTSSTHLADVIAGAAITLGLDVGLIPLKGARYDRWSGFQ